MVFFAPTKKWRTMKYQQLTEAERYMLSALRKQGLNNDIEVRLVGNSPETAVGWLMGIIDQAKRNGERKPGEGAQDEIKG